jgi:hypothetical protein
MSACIQEALRQVEFGTDGTTFNMFMVNEAEAAAMHVLTSDFHDLKSGDTFILVDCGGGTTDAGTYTIAHDKPLRLGAEVTRARGKPMPGSVYLRYVLTAVSSRCGLWVHRSQ